MKKPKPVKPKKGQESVWDYPRPPKLEKTNKLIEVWHKGICLARSNGAYRVLETSHPPQYYIPPSDVQMQYLLPSDLETHCEWKGTGNYYDLYLENELNENVAWTYMSPNNSFSLIKGYLAFYAGMIDKCMVDNESVTPQPGKFYGGWITSDVVGPFKGEEGSWGW
ncbi:DUF427 domain-containing protein [Marinigracilibium pacificum]|uniref:DUF427 domain-containing protein n=1 Tax=Marinigracilibium pacificum TaxID=2729599 RepID=A0A848IVU3_9BACT|nr:DUF427 domain-containing protein [Marinigracilibium pacificum]NMM48447.1 DUF427 domain-containing protein [Marinigracilibium pacificum]